MRELLFVLMVVQLVFILLYFIPILSLGKYAELRAKQKQKAKHCLSQALDKNASVLNRLLQYVKVAALALDLWAYRGGLAHALFGFTLVQLIK